MKLFLTGYRTPIFLIVVLLALAGCKKQESPESQIYPRQAVSSVRITPKDVHLKKGQSITLNVMLGDAAGNMLEIKKRGASNTTSSVAEEMITTADRKGRAGSQVFWTSSNPDLIHVDKQGTVTALNMGVSEVVVRSENYSEKVSIMVIDNDSKSFDIAPIAGSIAVGDIVPLIAPPGKTALTYTIQSRSSDLSSASVDDNGVVTALAPGFVSVLASDGGETALVDLEITPAETSFALNFLGNVGVERTLRFEFSDPLEAFPATYIWRAYPRQQQSYYTSFFWGNNGSFYPSATYYGFHPYPDWETSNQQFWEIAAPPGSDHVSQEHVVYDRWYIQVAVCREVGDKVVYDFYWDWPDQTRVIRQNGDRFKNPPHPVLVVGDAPWNQGNEVWNGLLRGFQFYDSALSLDEVDKEIITPGSIRVPWYLNLHPKPSDISDKSGHENHPVWVGVERPTLWQGIINEGIITRDFVHTPFSREL